MQSSQGGALAASRVGDLWPDEVVRRLSEADRPLHLPAKHLDSFVQLGSLDNVVADGACTICEGPCWSANESKRWAAWRHGGRN
jgi:hypothetical protein